MPLRVAMPLLKRPANDDFSAFYEAGAPIPSFAATRQPRFEAGQRRPDKLELQIPANRDDARNLYAMFPGMLKYQVTRDSEGNDRGSLTLRLNFTVPSLSLTGRRGAPLLPSGSYDTLSWLYRLNKSCLQFQAVTYDGVQQEKVRDALNDLLNANWNTYSRLLRDFPAEIVIRDFRLVGNRERPSGPPTNITALVKRGRADEAATKLREALELFFSDVTFLDETHFRTSFELPVDAGTWIGNAEDTISVGFLSSGQTPLNPVYLFRLLLKWRAFQVDGQPLVEFQDRDNYGIDSLLSQAPVRDSVHPLLWLLKHPADPDPATTDYLRFLDQPIEREATVNGQPVLMEPLWRLYVPPEVDLARLSSNASGRIHDLLDYEAVAADIANAAPEDPELEWRLDDYAHLVARQKRNGRAYPWDEEAYFTFDNASFGRIDRIWSQFSGEINQGATLLPLPLEAVLAMIARESGGSPRACGLEPWPEKYEFVENETSFASHPKYAAMTHVRVTLHGREVALQLRTELSSENASHTITAVEADDIRAELLTFMRDKLGGQFFDKKIDVFDSFAARVHELIGTNQDSTFWLSSIRATRHQGTVPASADWRDLLIAETGSDYRWGELLDDVADSDLAPRVSPSLMQTLLTTADERLPHLRALGVNGLPAAHDYGAIFEWLLTPGNSILAGMALMHQNLQHSGYDPLRQRITHYRSRPLTPAPGLRFGYTGDDVVSIGKIVSGPGTVQPWSHLYNAAVVYFDSHFGDAGFIQPHIRLAGAVP